MKNSTRYTNFFFACLYFTITQSMEIEQTTSKELERIPSITIHSNGTVDVDDIVFDTIEHFAATRPKVAEYAIKRLLAENKLCERHIEKLTGDNQKLITTINKDVQETKQAKASYEAAAAKTVQWHTLKTAILYGLHGISYAALGYGFIALHNDTCSTESHTSLHYLVCNLLG